jgi:predicted ATPase
MSPVAPEGMVGRAHELDRLSGLADRAADGRGAVVVVSGDPGIGKSHLVRAVLPGWQRRGFETYVAAAAEMEQRRPFGVIADALRLRHSQDPMLAAISNLLRNDERDAGRDPAGAEFQVAERVVEYVEDRVVAAPVAVVVEDLQWADPSSLMVLGWLAREGAQLPLLLMCTLRPAPGRPELDTLLASLLRLRAARLKLGPLSHAEVADVAATAAGGPAGDRLLRLVAAANGNPLHINELVAALQADGTLTVTPDGHVEVAEGQLPASLRETVLHRLAAMPPRLWAC